ncbi:MotA/TolQ/ExbB proton channel family protein [Halopseudomonas salegens]|uniref:Outer membrane transport energization protein ExbB n=1 Tax=Halopseudomonas salegens TaxID=1434072 RepID=A0A1H2DW37_9GAMM|nr:MotA/TolQ/ExbB proton channel family protein [Halopseudomonas salegens]SDT87041.1 outer membrane transport energization protein ExbB [Halopseudomonas salegens]
MLPLELPDWFLAQGAIAWPLLACSVLTIALLLERSLILLGLPRLREQDCRRAAYQCQPMADVPNNGSHAGWRHAVRLLQAHAQLSRAQREELLGVWLAHLQQQLQRRLRLLQLIGVLSPMLGLLGTVLGMLAMFQTIAADGGPVTPGVLADGLFQALYSTAWGLMIALPALGGGQALGLWCGSYVERMQQLLNRCLLAMDGLQPDLVTGAASPPDGWVAST